MTSSRALDATSLFVIIGMRFELTMSNPGCKSTVSISSAVASLLLSTSA